MPVTTGDKAPTSRVDEELSAFMRAIASQESSNNFNAVNSTTGAHGKWQIMPDNWGPWSKAAGLPSNAPKNAANQERVTRHIMKGYFNQFGSWDAVAVAWFAGPGRAADYVKGQDYMLKYDDGNLSVEGYINKAIKGLAKEYGGDLPLSAVRRTGSLPSAAAQFNMTQSPSPAAGGVLPGPPPEEPTFEGVTGQTETAPRRTATTTSSSPPSTLSVPTRPAYTREEAMNSSYDEISRILGAPGKSGAPMSRGGITEDTNGAVIGRSSMAIQTTNDAIRSGYLPSAMTGGIDESQPLRRKRTQGQEANTPPNQGFATRSASSPDTGGFTQSLPAEDAVGGTSIGSGTAFPVGGDAASITTPGVGTAVGQPLSGGDPNAGAALVPGADGGHTDTQTLPAEAIAADPSLAGVPGAVPGAAPEAGTVAGTTAGIGPGSFTADPLLGLAGLLGETSGDITGIGQNISSFFDPELQARLAELGLEDDIGTRNILDEGVSLLLGSAEQRRRLDRNFGRQQELTAANVADRGLGITRSSGRKFGLVDQIAQDLGRQQGESLGDFYTGVGSQMRGLLTGLGDLGLGTVNDLSNSLFQGTVGALNEDLAAQLADGNIRSIV